MACALLLVALVLAVACEQVADYIPGESGNDDATPIPVGTPILPDAENAGGPGATLPASAVPDHELARSVVRVRMIDDRGGATEVVRVGSGVVVDAARGLVLTSYPLVQPHSEDGGRAYTSIVVGLAPSPGGDPEVTFEAEIAAADPVDHLAVLRPAGGSLPDDVPVLRDVRGADVASVNVGATLRIFGYPAADGAISTQPVSVSEARIAGFRSQAREDGRAWIKTDARLPHTLAGGPVFDIGGGLLGVLVQERYLPQGRVGHARSVVLAADLVEAARDAENPAFRAPLMLLPPTPGTTEPDAGDGVWASRPAFAASAADTATDLDLDDYTSTFPAGTDTLYYEFSLIGLPNGEEVEERWFLDGVPQDALSSSYAWDGDGFGFVADRIFTPSANGFPGGRWRLEVWTGDRLRSTATALVGVSDGSPSLSGVTAGSLATPDATAAAPPASDAEQLLVFFDFSGFEAVETVQWLTFSQGRQIYRSPAIPWPYGDSGRTWLGYYEDEPLEPGEWEFEIYADGELLETIVVTVP